MSFWASDDKIPIVQTKVKIPAENGLSFNDGGLIHINIPANSVEFFQPKESYLEFVVDINSQPTNGKTRLQLDADLGGQVLIKDIRIFSGGAGGVLLEEIQNYNTLTAVKYDYESDDTIRNKRSLTEGTTVWSQACRNTRGVRKSDLNNVGHNPYFQPYTWGTGLLQKDDVGVFSDPYNGNVTGTNEVNIGQNKVKCLLPLNTGIFSNDRVFPCLLTEGLRIEILLEDAPKCLRQLDQVSRVRGFRSVPIFHSLSGHDIGDLSGAAQIWADDQDDVEYLYIKRDNNQTQLENFPLVVGETFEICDTRIDILAEKSQQVMKVSGGDDFLEVKSIEWAPGDVTKPAATAGGYWGMVKVGLTDKMKNISGVDITGTLGKFGLVSTSVAAGLTNAKVGSWANDAVSYQVSDVNLVLQKLEMPQGYVRKMMSMMKSGGTINYDFLSATNYKYSQLKDDVVANIRLPLSQTRARGILSVPTDAQVYPAYLQISGYGGQAGGMLNADGGGNTMDPPVPYQTGITYVETPPNKEDDHGSGTDGPYGCLDQTICSVRSGLVGIWDNATQYQWFYNGQLNPSRPVVCNKISNKTSIGQQPLIELEKALSVCGIRPLSFRKYHENAVIGRALSLQDGTYDTTGKDFNLQIEYSEGTPLQPQKNKLWMNFVHHIRRIVIKGNQISLQV